MVRPRRRNSATCRYFSGTHGLQPKQPDERLRVAAVADRGVELAERHEPQLDALALVAFRAGLVQVGGEVHVDLLVREARRRVAGGEVLPGPRLQTDLLGELAPRGLERRLALVVELPR